MKVIAGYEVVRWREVHRYWSQWTHRKTSVLHQQGTDLDQTYVRMNTNGQIWDFLRSVFITFLSQGNIHWITDLYLKNDTFFSSVAKLAICLSRMSDLSRKWVRMAQNGTNLGLFRSVFSTFWFSRRIPFGVILGPILWKRLSRW